MAYGLTPEGFLPKTSDVIRAEQNERMKAAFGIGDDSLGDSKVLGQLVGITMAPAVELWELAEAVAGALDPNQATGQQLVGLSALTGTVPEGAQPSTATLTLTGTPGSVVGTGNRASVPVTQAAFATKANATIVALTAWAAGVVTAVGDRVAAGGNAYVATTAGTTAAGSGPSGTVTALDGLGGVTWRYMGQGTGAVDVAAAAVLTGKTIAMSGAITVIDTPVNGWAGVINLTDADLGNVADTDQDLRIRREAELAAAGTSPVPAIESALRQLADVSAVRVFYNPEDTADADGVPPHSIEALVQGGDDQAIRDCLWANVAGGIKMFGTPGPGFVTGTILDEEGNLQTVNFTRPAPKLIYVAVALLKDPKTYPADGDDQALAQVIAHGDSLAIGHDVRSFATAAPVQAVSGFLDVLSCYIGLAPSPGASTTIPISNREIALYDSSRTTITSSDGTP